MGDDMIPERELLARHISARHEEGLQGRIEWDPDLDITTLMQFMAPEGPQFYFKGLKEDDSVPFSRIYGANFSAPRRFFLEEPFDEGFPFACMEDTELAWRWKKRGWSFRYSEKALCYHHHRYDDFEEFLARQHRAGTQARACVRRHPALLPTLLVGPVLQLLRLLLRRPSALSRRERWARDWRLSYIRGFLGSSPS